MLIYLARAKQAGITNRALISETQEADIIARMQATIQFLYLILLFGDKINPDYGWLEDVSEAQKKEVLYAVSRHLSFHAMIEKLVSNPIDVQSLYENPKPDPLTLAAVTELLELPQESDISICYSRFNTFYVDKRASLEKTVMFSSQSANDAERFLSEDEYMEVWGEDDIPSAQKVIDHVLDADYHQTIDNFLRYFAAKKLPKRFFTELKSLVLNQIQVCSHRFGLLRNLLDKEPSNVLDRRYEHLITHGFPLILSCENDENMTLISESTREYRAQYPLRLGENITMIATDSMEHQDILLNYLRENRACLQFIPDAYVPRLVRGIQEMVKLQLSQFNCSFN
ncbi:MAG: hypothetical protein NTU48_06355 [Legionellales bacterium]|nr:hypothetical protein [Legionellales bacterium]